MMNKREYCIKPKHRLNQSITTSLLVKEGKGLIWIIGEGGKRVQELLYKGKIINDFRGKSYEILNDTDETLSIINFV